MSKLRNTYTGVRIRFYDLRFTTALAADGILRPRTRTYAATKRRVNSLTGRRRCSLAVGKDVRTTPRGKNGRPRRGAFSGLSEREYRGSRVLSQVRERGPRFARDSRGEISLLSSTAAQCAPLPRERKTILSVTVRSQKGGENEVSARADRQAGI